MENIIALIIVALVVIYFGKFIKTTVDISTDMAEEELVQARSSQAVRHAKTNSKRTADVNTILETDYLSARDIISLMSNTNKVDEDKAA